MQTHDISFNNRRYIILSCFYHRTELDSFKFWEILADLGYYGRGLADWKSSQNAYEEGGGKKAISIISYW